MTTLLPTEVPTGSGIFHSPLFLVSGAVDTFRAIDKLRQATNSVISRSTVAHDERAVISSDGHQRRLQDLGLGCPVMAPRAERLPASLATSLHPSSPSSSPHSTYQSTKSSPSLSSPQSFTATKHAQPFTRSTLSIGQHRLAGDSDFEYRPGNFHPPCPGYELQPACTTREAPACKEGAAAHSPQSPNCITPLPSPTDSANLKSSPSLDRSWQNLAATYASALAGHAQGSSFGFGVGSGSGSHSLSEREANTVPAQAVTLPWSIRAPAWRPAWRRQDHQRHGFCSREVPGEAPGHDGYEGDSGPRPRALQSCQPDLSGGRGGSAISQSLLRGGRSSGQSPIDALRLHPPQLLPRTQTRQKPQGRSWTGRRVVSRRNVHTVQGLRELEDAGVGGEEEEEKEVAAAATGRCSDVVSSPPHLQQFVTVVAGALSRTAAQVAVHPLDTLKTRMQVQVQNPQLGVWRAVMCCPGTRARALAAWTGAAGARDLLLGLGAAIAGVLPASAVYFTVEPRIRSWLEGSMTNGKESPISRLAAAATAATLSALIRVPADVVKHRVQAYAFPSSAHAARAILATRGPAGLYAGFGATLLRDAPEIVIQFTVYRYLKELAEQRSGAAVAPPPSSVAAAAAATAAEHLLLGGAAGAAAALATTPLDVIKTQLQCGAVSSVPAAAMLVLRSGGPAALFGGLAPRLLQTTLCSALFFTCFEASKDRLAALAGAVAPSEKVPSPPPPEKLPAMTTATSAQEAAMVLKSRPQGWAMPRPPPRQRWQLRSGWWRRRHRVDGGESDTVARAADGNELWTVDRAPWAAGGILTPVALYAYAYAGAAVPVAAAVASAGPTPMMLDFQAPC
ncbi:hypothetical protein Vretifemale_6363 [Volvox reticuliferus]|uniref:Mitochondrial carrier domain-containing protein n=1 Tax=Volvox reticuliferus TaxID=1737510 RepID=A0A8J4CDW7_9CHLO|nr:hypothetical protein Vretifemale_6363 [Volvox reticuliferus]